MTVLRSRDCGILTASQETEVYVQFSAGAS